jgi:hypothetical protein
MNRVAALVLVALCPVVFAQASSKSVVPAAKKAPSFSWEKFFASPSEWNDYSARIIPNSQLDVVFHLMTSWIPGADHKGMFRYKLTASPELFSTLGVPSVRLPEVDTTEKLEKYVRRVGQCRMQMIFYDKDGFIDRKIPLDFTLGVDDSGHVASLMANDAAQMPMQEYKDLLLQGSWEMTWLDPNPSRP